ncbi:MAG TPA: type IV secretion system protein [Anaeromyxobacteraceae bacterium]|nr:type IV secretion system protein [Anaeromyxobacteraceae bacterium]
MFRLFTPLFAEIDSVTKTFANDVSSRLIVAIAPVLSAGLTLWFLLWGILVMRGAIQQPVLEFLGKVVRTALIVSLALGAGLYQSTVAELLRTAPDELAVAVAGEEPTFLYGLDNAPVVLGPEGSQREAALIDRAASQGFAKAEDAFEKGSLVTHQGFAFCTFGVLMILATVIMVGVGGAMILVAKVVLALLAALGPLFIAALLFEQTKRFFERWVAMTATYGLIIVLFACVFTFMLGIFGNYMTGVNLDGKMNMAYGIGGALVLTIVSVALLKELHHLAVGLGGGYADRIPLLRWR